VQAKKLEEDLSAANQAVADAMTAVGKAAAELTSVNDAAGALEAARQLTDTIEPTNDYDLARRKAKSLATAQKLMDSLAVSSDDLERAYSYYTQQTPQVWDRGAWDLKTLAIEGGGLVRALSSPTIWDGADQYGEKIKELDAAYQQFMANMLVETSRHRAAFEAASRVKSSWTFAKAANDDPEMDEFLRRVNGEIRRQADAIAQTGETSIAEGDRARIEVPTQRFWWVRPERSEVLESLYVSKAEFADHRSMPAGVRLVLTVEHPGYGVIEKGKDCWAVSFAPPGAGESGREFPSTITSNGEGSYLVESAPEYVMYPMRTRYFLTVALMNTAASRLKPESLATVDSLELIASVKRGFQ
jgi:hypothetical protein